MEDFLPVIILSGGLGTRVNASYPDIPKALIPINGVPFISHQLRLLAKQSVKQIIFCLGHFSEQLSAYLECCDKFGIQVDYSFDGDQLLGTGGAVLKAAQKTGSPFAVIYGDSYLDTSFAAVKKAFFASSKLALTTVYKNDNQWLESNMLCEHGLVKAYDKERPRRDMHYVDYGLSIFNHEAFNNFQNRSTFDLGEVFIELINKEQLAAYEIKERFYEAGSIAGIEELEKYLTQK